MRTVDQLINDYNLHNKVVLLRLDLNITATDLQKGKMFRLRNAYKTIEKLYQQNTYLVLISHRGRPLLQQSTKIQLVSSQSRLNLTHAHADSLSALLPHLCQLWNLSVKFVGKIAGSCAKYRDFFTHNHRIILLENVRFMAGEMMNNKDFAQSLCADADFFVNDAFAVAHRQHASVNQLPQLLPTYYGDDFVCTWRHGLAWRDKLRLHPTLVILGGNKTIDKLKILAQLSISDNLYFLLGGSIAYVWWQQNKRINQCHSTESYPWNNVMNAKRFIVPQWAVVKYPAQPLTIIPCAALDTVPRAYILGWRYDLSQPGIKEIIKHVDQLVWCGPLCRYDAGCDDDRILIHTMTSLRSRPFNNVLCVGGNTVEALHRYSFYSKCVDYISSGNAYLHVLVNLPLSAL